MIHFLKKPENVSLLNRVKADYYLQRARTLIRNKETKSTAFEGLQEELQQQEKDRYFKMCIDSEEDKKDSRVTYNPTRRLKGLS